MITLSLLVIIRPTQLETYLTLQINLIELFHDSRLSISTEIMILFNRFHNSETPHFHKNPLALYKLIDLAPLLNLSLHFSGALVAEIVNWGSGSTHLADIFVEKA